MIRGISHHDAVRFDSQNNLHELWALLNFLMPEEFHSSDDFDAVSMHVCAYVHVCVCVPVYTYV